MAAVEELLPDENAEGASAEEEDEDDEDMAETLVGYLKEPAEPSQKTMLSRFSFPSKVGGCPPWMVPRDFPGEGQGPHCRACNRRMRFLLQVYASQGESIPHAFHRSVMLFVCTNCQPNQARAFRAQLPRANEFYSYEPPGEEDPAPAHDSLLASSCCPSCGLPTEISMTRAGTPAPCEECGRRIRYGDGPAVFQERELTVEGADGDDDSSEDGEDVPVSSGDADAVDATIPADTGDPMVDAKLRELRERIDKEPEGRMGRSEEKVFEGWCRKRNVRDDDFQKFQAFEEANPLHVLRYRWDGKPLWFTSLEKYQGDPPSCERCGASRVFEFQVQPQLINLLGSTTFADRLDFGTICIFSCSACCDLASGTAYAEEFVFVQREPTAEWIPEADVPNAEVG
jgi:pre-rRNA-processing protein TSR4